MHKISLPEADAILAKHACSVEAKSDGLHIQWLKDDFMTNRKPFYPGPLAQAMGQAIADVRNDTCEVVYLQELKWTHWKDARALLTQEDLPLMTRLTQVLDTMSGKLSLTYMSGWRGQITVQGSTYERCFAPTLPDLLEELCKRVLEVVLLWEPYTKGIFEKTRAEYNALFVEVVE